MLGFTRLLFVAILVSCSTGSYDSFPRPSALRGSPGRLLDVASTSLTPVGRHGQLQVQGSRIVDRHGQAVRLRGMCLFWSQWMGQFWDSATVHWLRSDWRISVLRASMGVERGGYLEHPITEKAKVVTVVDAAIEAGIYVIIDWHDHHAQHHIPESKSFFAEMAEKYGAFPNVLFETFNEPTPGVSWPATLKPYHTEIVAEIRKHTQNIVILGTGEWSQHVDEAAQDPVSGSNIAYSVHFYAAAAAHNKPIQDRVVTALSLGVPVFASEWGVCHYTGQGSLGITEASAWLDFMDEHSISDTNWAIAGTGGSGGNTCAVLVPGAAFTGGWSTADLSEAGKWMRSSLRQHGASSCSGAGQDCRATTCCSDADLVCYERDVDWAECKASCASPWSCLDLGRKGAVPRKPVCNGLPCDSSLHCRSKWGFCGSSADHCNMESTWTASCTSTTASPPTLSPAPSLTTTVSPSCSADGQDCRATKCCSNPGMTCFEKDGNWGECKASCTPGVHMTDALEFRTPWSCKSIDSNTPSCSADRDDCRASKCCSNPDMSCFEKDGNWGECKASCTPGVDMNDALEFRTPWSCKRIGSSTTSCSADGHDCRASKCCRHPDMTCFEKDDNWGECKASCTPGVDMKDAPEYQTPWRCNRLNSSTPSCAFEQQDCRTSRCCVNPLHRCFEKDVHWAECKASCAPGLDANDAPQWQTPWSCKVLI